MIYYIYQRSIHEEIEDQLADKIQHLLFSPEMFSSGTPLFNLAVE